MAAVVPIVNVSEPFTNESSFATWTTALVTSVPVRVVFNVPVTDPNVTVTPALSLMVCAGSKVTDHSSLQAVFDISKKEASEKNVWVWSNEEEQKTWQKDRDTYNIHNYRIQRVQYPVYKIQDLRWRDRQHRTVWYIAPHNLWQGRWQEAAWSLLNLSYQYTHRSALRILENILKSRPPPI